MAESDAYKSCLRKSVNKLIRNLTDEGIMDLESTSYQFLEQELGRKSKQESAAVNEILLEVASRSGCPDRFLILQLFNLFFIRFRTFRDIFLDNPLEFLKLMVETDPIRNPLPGSKKKAKELKTEAIRVIKEWENVFVKSEARMKCMVVMLKKTKFVNYEKTNNEIEKEEKRKLIMEERKQRILQSTLTAYRRKFDEIKENTDKLYMEFDCCLNILVPSFTDDLDTDTPSTSTSHPSSSSGSINIFIPDLNPEIIVSSENDAIVEALLDAKTLLIHRIQTLRKLAKRLLLLKNYGEELTQCIIEYRDRLKMIVLKGEKLKIKGFWRDKKSLKKQKKRFDDDFIDVEISIDEILMVQYSKEAQEAVEEEKRKKDLEEIEPKEKSENKNDKKSKVKAVPFGLDLKYWGEERKHVEFPKNNADCHRFWRSADESTVSGAVHQSIYTQRQYTFIGESPKSDKVCRAKLSNGSLCPRRDFHSCPLHGSIVDRDDNGNPIAEKDRRAENEREETKRLNEAEEFAKKIEKDHEAKTRRKRKHEQESTPSEDVRSRLQKKLLDPRTVQRVSAVIDASRKNRIEKKFGQQFSHL